MLPAVDVAPRPHLPANPTGDAIARALIPYALRYSVKIRTEGPDWIADDLADVSRHGLLSLICVLAGMVPADWTTDQLLDWVPAYAEQMGLDDLSFTAWAARVADAFDNHCDAIEAGAA